MTGKSPPDHAPSQDARQVAGELRSSLSIRRRLSAPDEGEAASRLLELGSLDSVPPVAKPGPAAPFVKGSRRVLQAFLRPWLAAQTIFNRELARRFGAAASAVRDLERRVSRFEQAAGDLEERIRALEADRAGSGDPVSDRPADGGDVASVERLFVHSRLPRPPGRVMVQGPAGAAVIADLKAFGFDVAAAPVAGASFDAVIALSVPATDLVPDPGTRDPGPATRDAWGAIKPGGQLIATVVYGPNDGPSRSWGSSLDTILAPFLGVEMLVAARDGSGSIVVRPLPAGGDPPPDGGERLVLIHARRPDAPGR